MASNPNGEAPQTKEQILDKVQISRGCNSPAVQSLRRSMPAWAAEVQSADPTRFPR
jgi:hypothetical protein